MTDERDESMGPVTERILRSHTRLQEWLDGYLGDVSWRETDWLEGMQRTLRQIRAVQAEKDATIATDSETSPQIPVHETEAILTAHAADKAKVQTLLQEIDAELMKRVAR